MEETFRQFDNAMMPENRDIREAALNELRGNWTQPVLTTLVYTLVVSAGSGLTAVIPGLGGLAFAFLLAAPLGFGFSITFLNYMRGIDREDMVGKPFMCFQNYSRFLGVSALTTLYTLLWTLLFIVPGIIKAYAYAMTPYIMQENPQLTAESCIDASMKMMDGNKGKLFLLDLSFIGWAMLCILTLGIGYLWLQPYMSCSRAKFYEELKSRKIGGESRNDW
jgi:uncharacterized membrane protein